MSAIPAGLVSALKDRYGLDRELGQGGMATVYLAEDLKHHRQVAIKVLRPELAALLGAERFLKEIETTANLQHPHILPLFDSGQADSFLYYVMPYIAGESLRERLTREGELPVPEAVRIARAVASALGAAHRRGVVHRDIKPENILLADGEPVVADFGIARAISASAGDRLTSTGLAVGTPAYMSPEQASADSRIDGRTDLYSLGAVLYEMLAGDQPFRGRTAEAITARKLTEDPPALHSTRPAVPEALDLVVQKALARTAADRFQTAEELVAALDQVALTESGSTRRIPLTPRRAPWLRWVPWALAALAVVATTAAVVTLRPGHRTIDPMRFTIAVPELAITAHQPSPVVAFSPDGKTLAFVSGAGGIGRIYLRRLDSFEAAPIKGVDNAQGPAFSPDGQWLAFVDEADGNLKKVRLADATIIPLCSATDAHGLAWGPDGTIVFGASNQNGEGISRVSADGGTPELLLRPDSSRGESYLVHPSWLPSGDAILFTIDDGSGLSVGIAVMELRTRKVTKLLSNGDDPRFVPTGHVLYARDSALYAVPFDARNRRVTGAPRLVEPNVQTGWYQEPSQGHFAVSAQGTLAYVRGALDSSGRRDQVAIVTRSGVETVLDDPRSLPGGAAPGPIWEIRWSPDEKKVLVVQLDQGSTTGVGATYNGRLWIWDIGLRTAHDLSALTPNDFAAAWMPDGVTLVVQRFEALRSVTPLWLRRADGTGVPERLTTIPADATPNTYQNPAEVTPDGKTLLFQQHVGGRGLQIWALPLNGEARARQVSPDSVEEWGPTLSPNGRWLAFLTKSGIVVSDFPAGGRRFVLAKRVLTWPRWSADGRELLYGTSDHVGGAIWSIPVSTGTEFAFGTPALLFRTQGKMGTFTTPDFQVSRDGQRFLIVKPASPGASLSQIAVVVNWTSTLASPPSAADPTAR
jgi:serine/threonine-protein kinase